MYLSQLEALNIPYNLERFLSSPREGMIKGLWKNHSNEPQVEMFFFSPGLAVQIEGKSLYYSITW